ncbi:ribosome biogenesis GTPase Der [Terrihabitans rhizophilus]|jgi:GTP-binding protein|uniref:GTPase Der n=1 Tax=Terrihabitans rhizophilus TaxID=3092662 RepID=A0ABU4RK73_9HYPH|nr:ribosome biogenesis GTPase Der [Terrihabitans sp. PJ23]MDX6805237.1 ribosome biogenesis GTPase Der [Terrihabitans sp. PJ23]
MLPVVAIIGRPNVGKSTLFNRLVGRRIALVDDRPGVTRDRREGEATVGDLEFIAIDTAGLEDAEEATLAGRMRAQTMSAVEGADIILFVMDARVGITPEDEYFAGIVRKAGKPVVLVANKAEGHGGTAGAYDAFRLGLGDPVPLSAEHNEGFVDLYQALNAAIGHEPPEEDEDEEDDGPRGPLSIAVVGRPNAGKSTLINRLVGEDRLLTGPEAGITRDSIAVDLVWRGRDIRLVDTAGMRRKARIQDKLEKLAVSDSLRSIQFAEVVVVMLDATIPFEKQDLQIADLVSREGRALVIALNKWDLVEERAGAMKRHREAADRLLAQVRGMPLVPISAATGEGVDRLMEAVLQAHEVWNRRVPTARINRWLEGVLEHHPPPAVRGARVKLRYMTQTKARPPTFVLFGTRTSVLPESYVRYLVNGLREAFELPGTPIRLTFREPKNPYDPE